MVSEVYPYPWIHASKHIPQEQGPLHRVEHFAPTQTLFDMAHRYPNSEDGGFDLADILSRYQEYIHSGGSGTFITSSLTKNNYELTCSMSPQEIRLGVADDYGYVKMYVLDDMLNIEAYTQDDSGLRYPDLFARRLTDFCWEFLRSHSQTNWHLCQGKWARPSTNYQQYLASRDAGMDEIGAISSTWTGQFYARHGFRPSGPLQVKIDDEIPYHIVQFEPYATMLPDDTIKAPRHIA